MRKKNSSIQSHLIKFLCIYFFIFSLDTFAYANRAKESYFEKEGLNVNPDSKGFSFFNAPSKPQINSLNAFGNSAFLIITTPTDFGSSGLIAFEYTLNGGQNWIRYSPIGPPINYNTLTPNSITSLSLQISGQPTFIQIRAVNGSGAGLPSDRFPLVARLEGSPSSPEVVRADADGEVLRVTIKAPTSPGNSPVTGYQYSLTNGQSWRGNLLSLSEGSSPNQLTGTISPFKDFDASATTILFRAINDQGAGAPSPSFTITSSTPAPNAPVINSAIYSGSGTLDLNFTAPTSAVTSSTRYDYSTNNGVNWVRLSYSPTYANTENLLGSEATIRIQSPGLNPRTIQLRGANGSSAGPTSNIFQIGSPPQRPTVNSAILSNGNLQVSFVVPAAGDSPITGYEYSVDFGLNFQTFTQTTTPLSPNPGDAVTIGVSNFQISNSTEIIIRGVNRFGKGETSSNVRITEIPSAPVINSVANTGTDLSIEFTAPTSGVTNDTRYQYSTDNGVSWQLINAPVTYTNSQDRSGSAAQASIFIGQTQIRSIQIRGVNNNLPGPTSNTFLIGTPPLGPTLNSANLSNGTLALSFVTAGPGDGSILYYEYVLQNSFNWQRITEATSPVNPGIGVTTSISIPNFQNSSNASAIQIRAVSEFGKGVASNSVQIVSISLPGPPTIDHALVDSRLSELEIKFNRPTNTGTPTLTGYQYSLDGRDYINFQSLNITVSPITATLPFTGNPPTSIRVRAISPQGSGDASESASFDEKPVSGTPAAPFINGDVIVFTDYIELSAMILPGLSYYYSLNNSSYNLINPSWISSTKIQIPNRELLPLGAKIQIKAGNSIGLGLPSQPKTIVVDKSLITITGIQDKTYTGQNLTPVVLKYGTYTLSANSDYIVNYSNNKVPGRASAVFTLRTQFSGSISTNFNILKAPLTITAQNKTKVYGAANPTLTFVYTGLISPDTKVSTEPSIETTATTSSAVGTYAITLTGGTDANYEITRVAGEMVVTKAPLTITAVNKTKVYGDANPTLTFAYTGLVNGDTKVSTEPSIATTAAASSAVSNYPIILTGGSDANYTITRVSGEMAVTKAPLTITAQNKTKVYGAANPTLTFTYSGLVNGDTKAATEPTIATTATATSGVGSYPITLTGGSDANYEITRVSGEMAVTKAPLTITAQNKTKLYGDTNPTLTFAYTGFVNGDTKVSEEPSIATTATVSSVVGTYPITLDGGSDANYEITRVAGEMAVTKAPLTITAQNKTKVYGDANPTLTFAYTGLVNDDTKVSTEPSIATIATVSSVVGTYPITLDGGSDANYEITRVAGEMAVTKAPLTITAQNKTKVYGDANPTLTFAYTGLVNDDTKVSTEPSIATTATSSSAVGNYPITLTGGSDANYEITRVAGEMTVTKASLTITAQNKTKVYGDANPTLTFAYTGLVNGDTKVSEEPSIATTATVSSAVGTYPITLTGGLDANYDLTLVGGQLAITKAPLTITAQNKTKIFGRVDPLLTYLVAGLKGLDAEDKVISGTLVRVSGEEPGIYGINQGSVSSNSNYDIVFVSGKLEIIPARMLSVVALGTVQTAWGTFPTLPTKATVLTTDGQSFDVGVTWNTANLNVLARGLYVIPGAFNLPKGIENPDKLSISQSVRVLPKPAPRDVTINNNSFEASTTTFFIPVGAFVVNDPIDKIHVVSLFGTGYDNKYFEIKDNILFWSSKEPAAGKTTFSIVVRVRDRDGNTIEKFFEIRRSRPDVSSVTVYSAFSPNGDRINDTWGVPEVRFYQGVRIMVFEKDGKPLFSTENPDTRWDGTFNGKELAVGTYFWVIQIKETGEMRRGMLNLIRK